MQFIDTFLTPELLIAAAETAYPFNLQVIGDHLSFKVSEDADYEVFLPLVYFRHEAALTVPGAAVKVSPYKYFISNKGRVMNARNATNPKFLEPTLDSSGYPHVVVKMGKKSEPLTIHRAIACAFLPIPAELGTYHPKDLIVTHKDLDKNNFQLYNLQWGTPPGDAQ